MLETARYQWEDGRRRLEGEGEDTARSRHLAALVEAVVEELRKRVGLTFTLAELAGAYEMLEPGAAQARRRAHGRRRGRRSRLLGWALRALVLAVVFFAGLAVGKALEQAPQPGGTQTRVRTIEPRTIAPRERTVTVTTAQ
jgi:hypothetical protein